MGLISIIHPSRMRPKLARKAAELWLSDPGCDVEYIMSLDEDDPELDVYRKEKIFESIVLEEKNRSAIDAVNKAAKKTTGEVIVVMSDDFIPFRGWGKAILRLMHGKADWILKTQDGIQDWVITLPIMDRVYYERFGYIYHESYRHQWADTELTCVAELTGCKAQCDLFFAHMNKPGTKIEDELMKRNDATYEEGKANFINRKARMFDLPPADITGFLTRNHYTLL